MIPVYQTAFGGPDSPTPGDCFRACVASILELPINEVPHFCATEEWIPPLQAWFRERGWMPLLVAGDIGCWLLDAYHVAAGPGSRDGCAHCVVCRGDELAHDPLPGGMGLSSVAKRVLFVAIDPVLKQRSEA